MKKKKILVIEDEKKINQLLSINFAGEGFQVDTATSGEQGLEKVDKFMPDIVILDVRLPLMDGWEVCRRIKGNHKYKDILVVMLTALTQKADMEKAKVFCADGFIGKPFEIDDIIKKIKDMT
ncbi:MAG: hypothetical protein A2474_07785 [Elusimicrobia bacterium RIFOXYC2_FULL_34_12]|nr:MAG: hypothetical protein A2474_07785 [Elusimicrobia bacterium RIFOXYC2_FULL_34_12]OGS38740.1 MAG: hypothetical protein A2551_04620 [Elusimicrobia bacterium RIFOXYD2_FULL_34_30]HAM39658.1 two-component system response regulator [Elusimicrobiota bacterium]